MSSFSMWKFCTEIKAPAEALNWLEDKLSVCPEDSEPVCSYSRESTEEIQVWVEVDTEDDGDPFALADLVAEMQKLFDLKDPWCISWAVVKDRPRIDGFSGGAAVCFRGEVIQIDVRDWVREVIEKLPKEEDDSKLHSDQTLPNKVPEA